jgi:NTP pyrophosphatase (non-canonical NTP hydrolase)
VAYRHMHDDGWEYYDAPTGEDCAECQPLYSTPPDQSARIVELEEDRDQWRLKHDVACDTISRMQRDREQERAERHKNCVKASDYVAATSEAADEFNQHHEDMLNKITELEAKLAASEAKPVEPSYLRWQVVAFAYAMEERLRANDHKGGWDGCDKNWLLYRLVDETGELAGEVYEETGDNQVLHEAADVANFAMMIADVSGELAKPVTPPDQSARNHQVTNDELLDAYQAQQERIAELEGRWQQGYTSGYNDGVEDGRRTVRAELEAKLATSEAARKEAEKDVGRLDYMILNEVQVWECNCRYAVHEVTEHHIVGHEYSTAREAIDIAITQGKEKKSV